ncbi:MAG: cbb3-type cytochrome c oxidase subunit I [Verrucomicrobiota bacterium]|nr:cbb3-type cytochrome c oxidase subunit I [Verrucomicrobiota bacterium]
MNEIEKLDSEIDASCRVSLLALFVGAAFWLVVASVLGLIASLNFHMPEAFANCPWLTYGRVQPAADDALLYGFCIPAGLGVALWLLARSGRTPVRGALVPFVAAHLWHLGVLVGLIGILAGYSTGFRWLEFPRGASSPLFYAYLLLALWAMMTFGARRERATSPPQWFLVAALFWFPWIYSTANLLLVAWPVRGVTQAVVAWWFGDNLLFVWLALVGVGAAFYFLPKFCERPPQTFYLALFAFWTLVLFGSLCGIPQGAPVPAWLPVASSVAAALLLVPLLAVVIVAWRAVRGSVLSKWDHGPFCFVGAGVVCFFLSGLMWMALACPEICRVTEFTWFVPAQAQLQLYGFFALTMFGAIYHILPRSAGFELPFPKLARAQFWISLSGVALLVAPLAIGGVAQGRQLQNPGISFAVISNSTLPFLRVSTTGQLLLLLGNLIFVLNVFGLASAWKRSVLKKALALVKAPLETAEVQA